MPRKRGSGQGGARTLSGGYGPSNLALSGILAQPREGAAPPQHVLDKIADESITGGYKVSRKSLCKIHFIALSRNGECVSCSF